MSNTNPNQIGTTKDGQNVPPFLTSNLVGFFQSN